MAAEEKVLPHVRADFCPPWRLGRRWARRTPEEAAYFVHVKIKLFLCFNWAPRHEGVLGEWKYSSTHSLTSVLDGSERSTLHPGRLTPSERTSGTYLIGGWVGPRAVLDAVAKRKIPSSRRESNPRTPIVQPVAYSLYRPSYQGSYFMYVGFITSHFMRATVSLHN
jgi:hypothetical protein